MSKKKDKPKKKERKKKKRTLQQEHHQKTMKTSIFRWFSLLLLSLIIVVGVMYWVPGDMHYEITEVYTFVGDISDRVNLVVILPTSGPYQDVFEPDILWPGDWQSQIDGQLNVIRLTADLIAGEIVEAEISYRVDLWQGPAQWQGVAVRLEDLKPAALIQSDHAEIIEQADELTVRGNAEQTTREIFRFTSRHLAWPQEDRLDADSRAITALQTGIGGCLEHATLMTALLRAAEVPAYIVSGLAIPETIPLVPITTTWNHPAGAHAWVEVSVDQTWYLADSSWSGLFFQRDLFGWSDGKHLVYDQLSHESAIYNSLVDEAEQSGTWIAAMAAPLRFVAWSELPVENVQFQPQVTLRKIWDSRYLWIFSIILIMGILVWINERNIRDKNRKSQL